MKNFDRCIFILIAIGIWSLITIQIFEPSPLTAHGDGHIHYGYVDYIHDHEEALWHSHSYAKKKHDHSLYAESDHEHD